MYLHFVVNASGFCIQEMRVKKIKFFISYQVHFNIQGCCCCVNVLSSWFSLYVEKWVVVAELPSK